MSLREASVDLPAASRVRSRPAATASASASTSASLRPRNHGPIRQAFKSAFSRFAAAPEGSDAQASKSIFLKEASLYTCFLLAGWVDATPGALLPAIREHWNLSFVLVSMLFVGTFAGCIIAAASISPLMDRFGFGKIISVAAALGLVFPVVFLTMPPFPVLIVAMMFSGMSNSSLDALVNVWISQRPRSDVRLGVVHFLYGLGALSSPLAAIPFLHEGRKGIAFQYFFCVSLALALAVLTLVTVAFKLQRDELVEGPAQQLATDDASIELQPRSATQASDVGDDKDKTVPPTPGSSSHAPLELMPIPAPMPVPEDTRSGLYKLRAVVKQQKVQLLALFTMIYVGCEVTVGGWTSTFLIEVRNQETSANVLVSGFWAGIAFGRILLIPLTAWLGDELASLVYLVCAVGLQLLVWLVPNIIANAVALALLGIFLGPAFPIMIRVASKTIRPRAHLTAAISFISSFAAAGMALLPLLVGLASQAAPQGIKVLPPILVGLLAAQVGLWTLTNRSHFKQRFFSRSADDGAVEHDEDRLD